MVTIWLLLRTLYHRDDVGKSYLLWLAKSKYCRPVFLNPSKVVPMYLDCQAPTYDIIKLDEKTIKEVLPGMYDFDDSLHSENS